MKTRSLTAALITLIATASTSVAQWTVTNLNPAGATQSVASGISDGQQAGNAIIVGGGNRASLWSGTAASWVDLNPTAAAGSFADAISGGQQAGNAAVDGVTRASLWSGTAASWVDLSPAGSTDSAAYAISGGQQAGVANVGGVSHASLWNGSAASWVDLHPAGSTQSVAYAASGGQQAGYARVGGVIRASLWSGTAASWVDLHPAGATRSNANAISGGQQAGYVQVGGVNRASLWSGTAASWVDLSPTGATQSNAYAAIGGQQVGTATVGGVTRASLWSGTAASWVDLHAFVPAEFSSSQASGISSDGVNTYISGYGYNTLTSRNEALLWKSICGATPSITAQPAPSTPLPGATATLVIAAGGTNPITYQWRMSGSTLSNGGRLSGVNTPSMAITNVQASDQGTYDCIVTDVCSGSTSSNAADLSCRPIIAQQPATASRMAAGLQLSVSIPPGAVNTYRWRQNGQNLFNIPGLFSGATTRTLTLLAIDPSLVGTYDCVLTNVCGTTTSTSGEVYCPADLDNGSNTGTPDGGIDITDLLYFLGAFEAGSPAADLDNGTGNGIPDGGIDINDLLFFLVRFEAGC